MDGYFFHFYRMRLSGSNSAPHNLVKEIDLGIGLANFDLTAAEQEITGMFISEKYDIQVPENCVYVIYGYGERRNEGYKICSCCVYLDSDFRSGSINEIGGDDPKRKYQCQLYP